MKKTITILAFSIISIFSFAQKAEWKEMHNFHAIMSKTFHPAEDGNLKPLKDSVAILLAKAIIWQKSIVPSGYDKSITKPILKKLVDKCTELKKAVIAKKEDNVLTSLITEAHTIFHEIMEKCSKQDAHH